MWVRKLLPGDDRVGAIQRSYSDILVVRRFGLCDPSYLVIPASRSDIGDGFWALKGRLVLGHRNGYVMVKPARRGGRVTSAHPVVLCQSDRAAGLPGSGK
ncbi:unnamed protein product [Tuber aestivum]|uniref:Uncharacterized protein n=1 Tax=Tuber aestivum TaxID=59557 RepID=A0A292Q266_9PEZI|nr:unnamed protein product [Tuber aestivum]